MFTDCPSCERQFRIRAWQLREADGWVRCGYCGETFHALERLHDAPVKKAPADLQLEDIVAPEPQPENSAVPERQPEEIVTPEPQPEDFEVAEGDAPEPRIHLPDDEMPLPEEAAEDITTILQEDSAVFTDLPPGIDYEETEATGSFTRFIWAGMVFILAAVMLMQLAWFNRDRLMRDYPALTPWAEKVCERLQCDLIRFRDVSAIKLLNREVRLHPRYRDALLVNVTLVNHAEFIQPYPDIELAIFDTNGKVISHRNFNPAEYLGPDVSISSGMSPGAPVHFALELAGTTQEAVSFEFRFH